MVELTTYGIDLSLFDDLPTILDGLAKSINYQMGILRRTGKVLAPPFQVTSYGADMGKTLKDVFVQEHKRPFAVVSDFDMKYAKSDDPNVSANRSAMEQFFTDIVEPYLNNPALNPALDHCLLMILYSGKSPAEFENNQYTDASKLNTKQSPKLLPPLLVLQKTSDPLNDAQIITDATRFIAHASYLALPSYFTEGNVDRGKKMAEILQLRRWVGERVSRPEMRYRAKDFIKSPEVAAYLKLGSGENEQYLKSTLLEPIKKLQY